MRQILSEISDLGQLPSPPQVALKIIDVTRGSESGVADIADVLRVDPAIASKVLQVSNSAAYSRGREITTVSQAINILGGKTVSVIALGFSLKSSMPTFEGTDLTSDLVWRHNVATAVACRAVSRFLGKSFDETAFMCGLLSRIGQLILISAVPDRYAPVLAVAGRTLPTSDEEQAILGVTHHEVSGLLLDKWQLPKTVYEVVTNWGDTKKIDASDDVDVKRLAKTVRLGDAIRNLLFDDEKACQLESLHDVAEQTFGITSEEIDRVFIACQTELHETLKVFGDTNATDIDCEAIITSAREQLVQVGLGLATDFAVAQESCEKLERANDELKEISLTDALTGLPNRHALDRELPALDRAVGRPYSVVMIDIDLFKLLNDAYGHQVGDEALRSVGSALKRGIRQTDFVARYGGEEFIVILPFCEPEAAFDVAERIRIAIRRMVVPADQARLTITVSAGVASTHSFPPETDHKEIVKAADEALYAAKEQGRDRTIVHQPVIATSTCATSAS